MIYGNFDLRRGDHDGKPAQNKPPRWAGSDNPVLTVINAETAAAFLGSSAALTVPEHVRKLQEDLVALGFSIVGKPDGGFGIRTGWAVREFQIYASMNKIACVRPEKQGQLLLDHSGSPVKINNLDVYFDSSAAIVAQAGKAPTVSGSTTAPASYYVDSLQSVDNAAKYDGPISGVVNEKTRAAIEYWLDNDYRCPVIFEAWTISQGIRSNLAESGCNIWAENGFTTGAPRVLVRDFSDYFEFPTGRAQVDYQSVGYYQSGSFGGPNATKAHSWSPEADMSVKNITGSEVNATQLNTPALSTYRTIRVVAEAECFGCFDVLNAWDNALISAGPCHWTMGLFKDGKYGKGEFVGFIAYLKNRSNETFNKVFGGFGLYPIHDWGAPSLYADDLKTYSGWVKLTNDTFVQGQQTHADTEFDELAKTKEEAHYLKTWHWFYRMSMAGRTLQDYKTAMWSMAKVRLTDILEKEVTFHVGTVTVTSTLGKVFTSEKSVAILLRWHVYRPSHVVNDDYEKITPVIQQAVSGTAGVNWSLAVAAWGDAHETALTGKLLSAAAAINSTITASIAFGENQPQGAVRTGRNTFVLEV
ncbi:peptidoglycan-binding domain-containing protein [Pseudomonas sp. 1928-m]|uniref:peptidoglycan-binding domain-containing protein n=1 Tax=Pseudomonas sp. 1928-m TaxID=3033804 RepID=UPI0023E02A72|nr:peptidoglycan-binding domain-containing protein [Pseudomonas sp. 1928-m]MDF3193352.1 peptidoglycan-binding domain-containing protein [Pseudomonas sp. 1928-m]